MEIEIGLREGEQKILGGEIHPALAEFEPHVATDETVQDRPEEKREGEKLTQAAPKVAEEKG